MSHTAAKPNRRILVIDDNRAIHNDFRKVLGGQSCSSQQLDDAEASLFGAASDTPPPEGFEIDSAYQGQEGLERVQQALAGGLPYALAFVDIRMPPGWDGIETIGHIWKVAPDLQIVICTAYSDYSWNEMTAKLGPSDRLVILKKPFDNIEVSQLAHALTHKWQLSQQARQKMDDLESVVRERTAALVAEIAERKRSEAERQSMEAQLRQSQKLEAIGQLAAGIAHEINTPTQYVGDNTHFVQESFTQIIQVIEMCKTLVQAAEAGAITPETVARAKDVLAANDIEYLVTQIPIAIRETLEGVDRVTRIVRAMKDFSHPGERERVAADINRAVESTVTVARNEWKYVADLKLDLAPELPMVPCYTGEFNQCILNLVINAAHAIGDVIKLQPGAKGVITVSTRSGGDHVEIRVSDTGTGIPESVQPHIFEPFFTTKEVGKGTGQGLSMVYGCIVKRHGGSVHFETETGKGTTFILRLPVTPTSTTPKPPTSAPV